MEYNCERNNETVSGGKTDTDSRDYRFKNNFLLENYDLILLPYECEEEHS